MYNFIQKQARILFYIAQLLFCCHINLFAQVPYTVQSFDGSASCNFGNLPYRVYYPQGFMDTSCVIHVSRGGNGLGDDRGQLLGYVNAYVQQGYVVVQIDHRFAGNNIPLIAQYRGEEIKCIAGKVSSASLDYGGFQGVIDGSRQGYAGHSGGCMEGLEAAGTAMTHGDYFVPEIKAMYGMSPAGYNPDQFGIVTNPPGFVHIDSTAVFLIIGEQEKDVNGGGMFMATDWRLQTYDAMNETGPRFEALVQGNNTEHNDVAGQNAAIQAYNVANSLALFDTYLKGMNRLESIGLLSSPPDNPIVLSKKGTGVSSAQEVIKAPKLQFRLEPNPAQEQIRILFEANNPTSVQLQILDAAGQFVLHQTLPAGTTQHIVDLQRLPSGLYTILACTENTCAAQNVLKE